jgi:hypothetical protein
VFFALDPKAISANCTEVYDSLQLLHLSLGKTAHAFFLHASCACSLPLRSANVRDAGEVFDAYEQVENSAPAAVRSDATTPDLCM